MPKFIVLEFRCPAVLQIGPRKVAEGRKEVNDKAIIQESWKGFVSVNKV